MDRARTLSALLILCFAWAIAALASADWISLAGSSGAGGPAVVDVLTSSAGGLTVRIAVPGFERDRTDGFDRVSIPDTGFTGAIGAPMLPSVRRLIRLPAKSGFTVSIASAKYEEFDGYEVTPQQLLITDNGLPAPFTIDPAIYASDSWYPQNLAEVRSVSIWSGLRVAALVMNPLQFNPATGRIRVASEMTVQIAFTGTNSVNALPREPSAFSAQRLAAFRASVINFGRGFPASAAEKDDAPNILVIVDDDLAGSAKLPLLIQAFENDGNTVQTTLTTDIAVPADAASIKAYIQSVYDSETPHALEYVVFVGTVGLEHIPLIVGLEGYSGDAPYGFLEGDDYFSDVALGRFPAKTTDELDHMIDKTLIWKAGPSGEWMSKAVLAAHRQGYPDKYTAVCEAIRTYEYSIPPPTFTTEYGGESATNETLSAEINDGRMLINYRGHGDAFAWIGWSSHYEYFTADEINALTNAGMPSILFSIACDNADLTQQDPSFAESWLLADNGAAAVLGSVHSSFTVPNHEFDKLLFRALYDDGIDVLGDILNQANAELNALFQGDETYESYMKMNIEMFLWLGDPTIRIPLMGILGPTGLFTSASDISAIHLTWNDRCDDETGFVLEVSDAMDGPWSLVETLPPDTVEYDFGGLTEAQGKYFRVKATTDHGDSYYSNVAFGQTLANAPTDLEAEALAVDSIRVQWTDNSAGETAYRVLRKGPDDADWIEAAYADPDSVSFTDASLTEGTSYEYAVEAVTAGGASRAADTAAAFTLPSAPANLQAAIDDAENGVTLTWTDRSGGEDGFTIFRRPYRSEDAWASVGDAPANASSFVDDSLAEGEKAEYVVAAFNASGLGPYSDPAAAQALPAAPDGLTALPVSVSSVSLAWSDRSVAETGYELQRSFDGDDFAAIAELPEGATDFIDAGLTEGTLVYYRVKALGEAGPSAASNIAETRTLPERPTNLSAERNGATVALLWTDNSDAETGYRVERSDAGGPFTSIAEIEASETQFLDDYNPREDSRWRVAAFHVYGQSEYSNLANADAPIPDDDTADDSADDTADPDTASDDDGNSDSGCGC